MGKQQKRIIVRIRNVEDPRVQAALTRLANALLTEAVLADIAREKADKKGGEKGGSI